MASSITSATLPLYEGGAPKACNEEAAGKVCSVPIMLPLLTPLRGLTRLMLQGSPPQPKGLEDSLTQANIQLPPFRKGFHH